MYSCTVCNKNYTRINSLYAHTRAIHGTSYTTKTSKTIKPIPMHVVVDEPIINIDDLCSGKLSLQEVTDAYASKLSAYKQVIADKHALLIRPTPFIYLKLDNPGTIDTNMIDSLLGKFTLSTLEDLCIACRYADVFEITLNGQLGYDEELDLVYYFDGNQIASVNPDVGLLYNIYSTIINKIASKICKPMQLVPTDELGANLIMQENDLVSDRFHKLMYSIMDVDYTSNRVPKNKKVVIGTLLLGCLKNPIFNIRFNPIIKTN